MNYMQSYRHASSLLIAAALLIAACQAPTPADPGASMKPAVDALIDAWNTGNLDQLDAFIASDFERRAPDVAPGTRGVSGLKEAMRSLRTAYPDIHLVVDELYYADDVAFVRWTATGTNTGSGDFPPTGKPIEVSGLTAAHFRDGMIVLEDVYFDSLVMLQQLGFALTPPAK